MNTTPAELLGLLYDDLQAWAEGNGGVCALSQSPSALLELLLERTSGWRLIVHWEGDEPADARVRSGPVLRNRFRLIVDGQLGPTATPRLTLVRERAGRAAFLAVVDAVRQRAMSYRFPWLAEPNNRLYYDGTDEKIPLGGDAYLAAYNLSFHLFSTMELPSETVDLSPREPA